MNGNMKAVITSLGLLTITLLATVAAACMKTQRLTMTDNETGPAEAGTGGKDGCTNAIYHWRTTFAPDSSETAFISRHHISRIYLKMFDVAFVDDYGLGGDKIVPIATTIIDSAVPEGVEVIPVVYITIDALRGMAGETDKYATLIVERVRAMMRHNRLGKIGEVQFDCDWTASTRATYAALCSKARSMLHEDFSTLSVTVRLHQLDEAPMPADRGVLMLYNTGALKDASTRNSILDVADVKPYLKKKTRYAIPLDYAYPAFGWGIVFGDGKFKAIVSDPDSATLAAGDKIRRERPTPDEIIKVKKLVEASLGLPARGNIIYHLDQNQLKHYTPDEIDQIYFSN